MSKSEFATFCETYNQSHQTNQSPKADKLVYESCTKHMRICVECNSVYEYRTPTGAKGARRVYKYSQLPRMGFPEDVCQHCMDNSVLVEQY